MNLESAGRSEYFINFTGNQNSFETSFSAGQFSPVLLFPGVITYQDSTYIGHTSNHSERRNIRNIEHWCLPSGKRLHNYGKIHHFIAGQIDYFYGHFQ